jgi:hypothetical protein
MAWLLDNPERPYIDSSKTDVMRTWKRHGFVPPSEQRVDFHQSLAVLNNLTIRGNNGDNIRTNAKKNK